MEDWDPFCFFVLFGLIADIVLKGGGYREDNQQRVGKVYIYVTAGGVATIIFYDHTSWHTFKTQCSTYIPNKYHLRKTLMLSFLHARDVRRSYRASIAHFLIFV